MPRGNVTRVGAVAATVNPETFPILRAMIGSTITLIAGIAVIGGNTDFVIEVETVNGTLVELARGTATSTAGIILSGVLPETNYRVRSEAPAAGNITYDMDVAIFDPSEEGL